MSKQINWFFILLIVVFILTVYIMLICGGCSSQDAFGLRFSPSEAIKSNSELTHTLAKKIDAEGTEPKSEVSRKVVSGTATSLAYTGRPKVPPQIEDFDYINERAQADAEKRPDADYWLELGLGITALIGGGAGVKLAQNVRKVYAKAKGFAEVVGFNEQFKKLTDEETWELFKRAQVMQTATTKQLVAEVKTDTKLKG